MKREQGLSLTPPQPPDTNFYMLVGDNSYNYSYAGSNLAQGIVGDLDGFYMRLNPGMTYSVVALQDSVFSPGVTDVDFKIADRYGNFVYSSVDYGSYSGYTVRRD